MRCVSPYLGWDGRHLEIPKKRSEEERHKTMTREIRQGLMFMLILLAFIPVLAWAFLHLGP